MRQLTYKTCILLGILVGLLINPVSSAWASMGYALHKKQDEWTNSIDQWDQFRDNTERDTSLEQKNKEVEPTQKQLPLSTTCLILACFIILLALLSYYQSKLKQKVIRRVEEQNQEILIKNKKLDKLNKDLTQAKIDAEFARDSAIRSDKTKSAFLDVMSHEIRTPISGILGMMNVLKGIDLDTESKDKLAIIEQSSNDLLDIFNDILEFVKLESGILSMEDINFNLRNAVSEVKSLYINRATKKGLEFEVFIDENCPVVIRADEVRFKQILKSLLSNAVKFTNKGQVQLNILQLHQDEKRSTMRFEVIDTGIGMSLEEVKKLFTAFSTARTSFSREYNGIGLSLAIVKKLVHLMNSTIQVESSKGMGSRFWFDLNLNFIPQKKPKKEFVLSRDIRYNILLAEDNLLMQKVGAANLQKYGDVDIADDGQIAFEKFKLNQYDIVVMDLQMPNVNGWESTILIRDYEKLKEIKPVPIIALTANVTVSDRKKSYESGMDYFAEKPIRPEVLDRIFAEIQNPE